jgi:hypothetical protein
MAVYTVHEPPRQRYQSSPAPERFALVRDGFSFWAFVLAPLWMLRHQMWIVFIGYVGLFAGLQIALHLLGASGTAKVVSGLLLALLVGFEAGTLRRFTLGRRGWSNVGVVVGDNLEMAERRFFDFWVNRASAGSEPTAAPLPPAAPSHRRAAASSDIIGLFPEAGGPR